MNNKFIIQCPYCFAEYLPAEIIFPKEFFGTPHHIIKDGINHKIQSYDGESLQLNEDYICDYCNGMFTVKSKLSFTTAKNNNFNFSEDYKSSLVSPKILLDEEK